MRFNALKFLKWLYYAPTFSYCDVASSESVRRRRLRSPNVMPEQQKDAHLLLLASFTVRRENTEEEARYRRVGCVTQSGHLSNRLCAV